MMKEKLNKGVLIYYLCTIYSRIRPTCPWINQIWIHLRPWTQTKDFNRVMRHLASHRSYDQISIQLSQVPTEVLGFKDRLGTIMRKIYHLRGMEVLLERLRTCLRIWEGIKSARLETSRAYPDSRQILKATPFPLILDFSRRARGTRKLLQIPWVSPHNHIHLRVISWVRRLQDPVLGQATQLGLLITAAIITRKEILHRVKPPVWLNGTK